MKGPPLIALVAVMGGVAAGCAEREAEDKATSSATPPVVTQSAPLWAFDVANDRRLVGAANNVFIGKVLRKADSEPVSIDDTDGGRTNFAVAVEDNLKGRLSGEVLVSQSGGMTADGELIVIEGDGPLEPGQAYLFVTRNLDDDDEPAHTITAEGYSDLPIESEAERRKLTERFLAAIANEIPYKR